MVSNEQRQKLQRRQLLTEYGTESIEIIETAEQKRWFLTWQWSSSSSFHLVFSSLCICGIFWLNSLSDHGIIEKRASAVAEDQILGSSRRDSTRSLLLLRHAESSWDVPANMADEDRPLTYVGIQDAQRLGKYLHRHHIPLPDHVYASPTNRTRATWAFVKESWALLLLPDDGFKATNTRTNALFTKCRVSSRTLRL